MNSGQCEVCGKRITMYHKPSTCGQTFTALQTIGPARLNKIFYNQNTVEMNLQDFTLGKLTTIIEWKALAIQYMIECGLPTDKVADLISTKECFDKIADMRDNFISTLNDLLREHA